MKKTLLSLLLIGLFLNLNAVTKVAYITFVKTMAATATTNENDPIIQVLKADANLDVTVKALTAVTATDAIADLADYDVVIVQESFSSSAGMLTPAGALALKSIPKPFIYNKTYALKSGRALTTSSAAGGKESNGGLTITVDAAALSNDLFKACTFGTSNDIALFNALTKDDGTLGDAASTKSINYSTGNTVSGSSLLASPTVLSTTSDPVSVCVNDMPSGTTIDSETTIARAITFGMNYGAICAGNGTNITDNCLTIWRNAVYILAGLPVPSTKVSLPTGIIDTKLNSSIVLEGRMLKNADCENINIYNVNGKLVSTSKEKEIDLSNLINGIYFIKGQSNTLKVSLMN